MSALASLLAEARAGSADALGRLLDALRPYLALQAAARLPADVRTKVAPSDLVQETLVRACRAFPQFRGQTEAELRAWLGRILARLAVNAVERHQGAAKRAVGREVPLPPAAVADSALFDAGDTPSAEAQAREQWERMDQAFARLKPDDQAVIRGRLRDQQSFAELAAVLGCEEDAVRRRWSRAMARWQAEVERDRGPA